MMWHEFVELQKSKEEYNSYVVEKEILLDNEALIKACEEFDKIIENFLKAVRENIFRSDSDLVLEEIYKLYKPDFDQYQKKIDDYIKSQLRPNRIKT